MLGLREGEDVISSVAPGHLEPVPSALLLKSELESIWAGAMGKKPEEGDAA